MPDRKAAAAEATRALLANLWQKNLPVQRERLLQLEAAAAAALTGTLPQGQRTEAAATAHKLAGSLGMFGYPQGTELARALEGLLEGNAALDANGLSGRVAALRAELEL